jgi:hypothetical protein
VETIYIDETMPPVHAPEPSVRALPPPVPAGRETSKFDVSALPTTTCNHDLSHEHKVVVGNTETSKNDVSDINQALQSAGIGRNLWPELTALPHVDAEYIHAMHTKIQTHPDPRKRNTGFLIHCIRAGDPAPTLCPACGGADRHHPDCRHRYKGGKYADLVES